jgi:hypothetical protein
MAAKGICRYVAAASAGRPGAAQAGHSVRVALADCGGCGGVAQPARTRITGTREAAARTMWVIYLEMGVALALLILIVWWTWPAKRPDKTPRDDRRP